MCCEAEQWLQWLSLNLGFGLISWFRDLGIPTILRRILIIAQYRITSLVMAAPQTDLYGFPVTLTELQRAECKQCDALSDAQQPTWMTYIEKDRLPTSDSKIKDMIRKVGKRSPSTRPRPAQTLCSTVGSVAIPRCISSKSRPCSMQDACMRKAVQCHPGQLMRMSQRSQPPIYPIK